MPLEVKRIISGNNVITTLQQMDSVPTHTHTPDEVQSMTTLIQVVEELTGGVITPHPIVDDVVYEEEAW